MKILITGGAGYIGSTMVPRLLEQGHEVTVLDTFERGTTELAAVCANENFTPVKGDARDTRLLDELVPQADVLVPLAALVGAPLCKLDPIAAKTLNQDAVVDLVKRTSKDQKVVFPVTNSGYGIGESGKSTHEGQTNDVLLHFGVSAGASKNERTKVILKDTQEVRPILLAST